MTSRNYVYLFAILSYAVVGLSVLLWSGRPFWVIWGVGFLYTASLPLQGRRKRLAIEQQQKAQLIRNIETALRQEVCN